MGGERNDGFSHRNPIRRAARRFLERAQRHARSLVRTHRRRARPYDTSRFWDDSFYVEGVSDARTIRSNVSEYRARYHYAATETVILRALHDQDIALAGARVLDVGAGAGHWVGFYRSLGAGACDAVDVSQKCVDELRQRFAGDPAVRVHHGTLAHFLGEAPHARWDLVNAIGVMFHVVEDPAWEDGLRRLAEHLEPGGLLIASGWFGWTDLDVQRQPDGTFTKRLRSHRHWRRALRRAGFRDTRLYRNRADLFIDGWIPENSILLARR